MLADLQLPCSLFVLWLPLLFWVFIWSPVDSRGYGPEPAGAPGRGASILPPCTPAMDWVFQCVSYHAEVTAQWLQCKNSLLFCVGRTLTPWVPVTSSSRPFHSDSLLCLVLCSAISCSVVSSDGFGLSSHVSPGLRAPESESQLCYLAAVVTKAELKSLVPNRAAFSLYRWNGSSSNSCFLVYLLGSNRRSMYSA